MLAWLALVSVDSLETQISWEHLKLLKHQDFLQFDESFPKRELISHDCNVFIRKKPAKIWRNRDGRRSQKPDSLVSPAVRD